MAGLAVLGCGDDDSSATPGDGSTGTSSSMDTTDAGPDTGSGTADGTSTGAESTGPATVCGNGVVEPGEDCDDENMEEDDECYSNCTIPYEVPWTQTHDGGEEDLARDVVLDAAGNVYVLGSVEAAPGDFDLWLRQYTPDGEEGFTWTYAGAEGGDDFGRTIALHDSGDLLIAGTETTTTGQDILVMRLEPGSQTIVWSEVYDGPGSGPGVDDDTDFANSIATDGMGRVLVMGTERVDGQEWDLWFRAYDADGGELWTTTHDEAMLADTADAVVTDGSDQIYLVGNVEVAANETQGWVRKHDAAGGELWTQTLPGGVVVTDAAIAPNDELVISGIDTQSGTAPDFWVGRYDGDFNEVGATTYDEVGLVDIGQSVTVGASGDVYVVGSVSVSGRQEQVWAGRYSPDLSFRWWHHLYGNEDSNLADVGLSVAVSDDESRVVLVGYESIIGQSTNVWVRMLAQGPTP